MSRKLILEEITTGVYRVVRYDNSCGGGSGLSRFMGKEIVCDGKGEDLVENVFKTLSGLYKTQTCRFMKKLHKKAEEIVGDYQI